MSFRYFYVHGMVHGGFVVVNQDGQAVQLKRMVEVRPMKDDGETS